MRWTMHTLDELKSRWLPAGSSIKEAGQGSLSTI